jgi:hypothetical protein
MLMRFKACAREVPEFAAKKRGAGHVARRMGRRKKEEDGLLAQPALEFDRPWA